jgi:hypothetical protein
MVEYKFTSEEIKAAELFSEAVDTSFYSTRNQFNESKRKKDSLIGKLGEFAAFHYLKDKISNLSFPDLNIYDAKQKSWDFDLKGDNANIHVKTQDLVQGEKFGVSWIFQFGDGKSKSYDKEIFDKISDNQYVTFVSIDLERFTAYIRGVVLLEHLHNKKLFGLPKLEHLQRANKLAVYLKDLERYPDNLFVI